MRLHGFTAASNKMITIYVVVGMYNNNSLSLEFLVVVRQERNSSVKTRH